MLDSSNEAPAADRAVRASVFFVAVTLLYISFGTVLGFVQGGLPPILRARGLDVTTVGLAFLLYLPIGLGFLWAPLIDRARLPVLGPRSGWILLMQAVVCFGLAVLGAGEAWPLAALFAIGLLVTTAVTTMDIALEALIVDSVSERQRSIAAACKIVSFCIGAILGGGVIVALTDTIGWPGIFLVLLGLGGIALVAAILLGGMERRGEARAQVPLRAILRRPGFMGKIGLSCVLFSSIVALFALNRVALLDLGMSLETNGWLVGTVGPVVSIAGALLAAAGIRMLGSKVVFYVSAAGAIATGLAWAVAAAWMDVHIGTVATLAGAGWLAGMYTLIYAAILRWSVGPTSATDYAVLFSIGNLAGLIAAGLATQLIAAVGWSVYYAIATGLFIVAVGYAQRSLLEVSESPDSLGT